MRKINGTNRTMKKELSSKDSTLMHDYLLRSVFLLISLSTIAS